jgi:hypothetical protein
VGIEHLQKKMGSISSSASQCHIRVVEDNGCLIVDVSPPPPEQKRVTGSLERLRLQGRQSRERLGFPASWVTNHQGGSGWSLMSFQWPVTLGRNIIGDSPHVFAEGNHRGERVSPHSPRGWRSLTVSGEPRFDSVQRWWRGSSGENNLSRLTMSNPGPERRTEVWNPGQRILLIGHPATDTQGNIGHHGRGEDTGHTLSGNDDVNTE